VRLGGLAWHSSQRGLLAQRGMTATLALGVKSSILVATTVRVLWIWLTDDIPEGMDSSLIHHCFDMYSLEMIRNLIKISQWTQNIESRLNSSNSWVHCFINNLTTSNYGMTQKIHNMYCNFISIRVMKSFSELYHWISNLINCQLLDSFTTHIRRFGASKLMILGLYIKPICYFLRSFTTS
jgi:hypothetical protein